MNNNPNEELEQQAVSADTPVLTPVDNNEEPEILAVPEESAPEIISQEEVKTEDAPATAEAIVASMEEQAAKAADAYDKKEAPVAPQQDRIQLIDTKPKLHAVQLGGVTMSTEKKEEVSENTEVLEPIEETPKVEATAETPTESGSKKSTIGLFLLFGGLLALVIFLPDISAYINTQKYLSEQPVEEEITTGTLECTFDDSSETLDYSYTFTFTYADSKISRLKSVTEVRGDVSLDETELDELKSECDLLENIVTDLSGISVSCKLENGLLTKSQTFNFSSIVVDDAITAYIEAGGSYPFYRNGDDIDEIERNLISSNYHCERSK